MQRLSVSHESFGEKSTQEASDMSLGKYWQFLIHWIGRHRFAARFASVCMIIGLIASLITIYDAIPPNIGEEKTSETEALNSKIRGVSLKNGDQNCEEMKIKILKTILNTYGEWGELGKNVTIKQAADNLSMNSRVLEPDFSLLIEEKLLTVYNPPYSGPYYSINLDGIRILKNFGCV